MINLNQTPLGQLSEFVGCVRVLTERGQMFAALEHIAKLFSKPSCAAWFGVFTAHDGQPYDGPEQWQKNVHRMVDKLFTNVDAPPVFLKWLQEALVPGGPVSVGWPIHELDMYGRGSVDDFVYDKSLRRFVPPS